MMIRPIKPQHHCLLLGVKFVEELCIIDSIFEENFLLTKNQFGFKQKHSTFDDRVDFNERI